MLETKCVPSVRSILFIAILTKILGKAIFDSSIRGQGNARQYSQAVRQGRVHFWGLGTPKEPQNGRRSPGHCICPPFSQHGAKLGLGLEAALQERPWQALGAAILPAPTLALGGWCGRMAGWGYMAASGQGAKRTQS